MPFDIAFAAGQDDGMAATLKELRVKLFTDGADKAQIQDMATQAWIRGFTTNPSLLKAAQVSDYASYARELVAAVPDRHISFEVFSDDIPEMVAQARQIATWGPNVYVKLPVTTTKGEPLFSAVRALSQDGIKVNLTAVFTAEQAASGVAALSGGAAACVSVFAGRLADAGIDYRPIMKDAVARARQTSNVEIIWASTLRSLQRHRGRRNQMPHHYGTGGCAEEDPGAWNKDGRGTFSGCGQGVPRGCCSRRAVTARRVLSRSGVNGDAV